MVTGIPMEFQFGTNWAAILARHRRRDRPALVMEGVFSFFLESAFLGLFLYGEKKLGPVGALVGGVFAVFVGSWPSGFFIIVTDAWMQHPVAFRADRRAGVPGHQFLGIAPEPLGV